MCGYTGEMEEIAIDKSQEKVSSSNRRNNKPLMEKRRRQRINDCLNQLKSLVLQAMNKDSTQYSKLEKADILEMTVKHLKLVQRQHMTAAMATDPHVVSKYRAGYNECATEVARYLDTVNGGNPDLKTRLLGYLGNTMMQFPVIPVYQGMMSPYHVQMASSQHGFQSQYNQDNVGPQNQSGTTNSAAFGTAQNYSCQSSPPLDTSSHLGRPVHSMHSAHPVSPISRRVHSPSDSDSGLSDRSSPLSHDENGNYSVFNINNQFSNSGHGLQSEHSSHFVAPRIKTELVYSQSPQVQNRSQKRKCDFSDDVSASKRRHMHESQNAESVIRHARQMQESDNMWRPW